MERIDRDASPGRRVAMALAAGSAPGPALGLALGLALASALATGCRQPEETSPYLDLAARSTVAAGVRIEVAGERRGIWLDLGSVYERSLFAAPRTVLRASGVSLRGDQTGLTIELDFEGEHSDVERTLTRSASDFSLELSNAERVPVTVRLAAQAQSESAATGGEVETGVWIEAPSFWAPQRRGLPVERSPAPRRPNVLIYLVDTLRRDRLGCYGYERDTSPEIDRFAAAATVYERAVGQSAWTKASVASLLTGVWPPTHGAIGWKHKLPEELVTLPEAFAEEGYETAAFVTNPNVVRAYGFDQGYEHFVRRLRTSSSELNGLVFEWLDERQADGRDAEPFFLYVHSMDPHAPYHPPEPHRSRLAPTFDDMPEWSPRWRWPVEALPYLSDAYDAEIAANDASFGALLDRLRALGLFDETVIVLLSDHGEEFREHGRWRHGNALYGESIDMPLIVKYAGQTAGDRVARPVQHVDLLPTLLELIDVSVPQPLDGSSLRSETSRSPILSHLRLGRRPLQYSVVDGDWKLIRTEDPDGAARLELFDRSVDPGELADLAVERPIRAAAMSALVDEKLAAAGTLELSTEPADVDAQLERELRALGYLQ